MYWLSLCFMLLLEQCLGMDRSMDSKTPLNISNPKDPLKYFVATTSLVRSNGNFISTRGQHFWNLSYAPYTVLCPSSNLVRIANDQLGEDERLYMSNRTQITELELRDLLSRHRIPSFDFETFLGKKYKSTKIAIAVSGGGFRSMLLSAGVLSAYDLRTPNATDNLGGLLQATSYIGGISGGSWLVMSNFIGDFQPIYKVKDDNKGWSLDKQLLEGIPSFDPGTFQNNIVIDPPLETTPVMQVTDASNEPKIEKDFKGNFISGFLGWFGIKTNSVKGDKPQNSEDEVQELSKSKGNSTNIEAYFVTLIKSLFSKNNTTTKGVKVVKNISLKEIFSYYKELQIEVRDKRKAGFHISLTDYWGRALARRIFSSTARTPGATLSAGTLLPSFQKWQQPFPIICSVERSPHTTESSKDSHLFEFTPYEFGSWDSYLNAFIPIKYLGSSLNAGYSIHKTENENISICISGFDSVSFVTGTSSSLFNHVFVYLYKFLIDMKSDATVALEAILKVFGLSAQYKDLNNPRVHPDYALYSPNPFYGLKSRTSKGMRLTESTDIYLVDGGDDGQNIPLHPFLRRSREVDLILSFDMTADKDNYPNGTTIQATVERYHNNNSQILLPYFTLTESVDLNNFTKSYNSTKVVKSVLPYFPTPDVVIANGLNQRPIFLGCDLRNDYPNLNLNSNISLSVVSADHYLSSTNDDFLPPLIVHTSNAPYTYQSNTSTFQLSYEFDEVNKMIDNGYNLATFMNSTYYNVCINCAILKREFDRIELNLNQNYLGANFSIPSVCRTCFREFCWHR